MTTTTTTTTTTTQQEQEQQEQQEQEPEQEQEQEHKQEEEQRDLLHNSSATGCQGTFPQSCAVQESCRTFQVLIGSDGINADSWLGHPITVIRVENGEYLKPSARILLPALDTQPPKKIDLSWGSQFPINKKLIHLPTHPRLSHAKQRGNM